MEPILFTIGVLVAYHGIFHWPDKPKQFNKELIVDAEWEEVDPRRQRIDTYV